MIKNYKYFLLLFLCFTACAPKSPALTGFSLIQRPISSKSEELAERFYNGEWQYADMYKEVTQALKGESSDCLLHEMAGHLAILSGAGDKAIRHFMQAAADDSCSDGELNIYMAESVTPTFAEQELFAALLEHIFNHTGDIRRKVTAGRYLQRYYAMKGREKEAAALAAAVPYIREWRLLGSLDNDHGKGFNTIYPPEHEEREAESYSGMVRPVSWRQVKSDQTGQLSLDNYLSPNRQAVAYAKVYVKAPEDGRYKMVLRSTASTAISVNGEDHRFSDEYISAGNANFDNIILPLELTAGWNVILIKTAVLSQEWSLRAYFLDEKNNLAFLETSAKVQELSAPAKEKVASGLMLPPPSLAEDGRLQKKPLIRQIAAAQMQAKYRNAQELLQNKEPIANPLYTYFAAHTYLKNGYAGKALDVLQKSLSREEEALSALLVTRALYYAGKEIWDRALGDLALAKQKAPKSRLAQISEVEFLEQRGWEAEAKAALYEADKNIPDLYWAAQKRITLAESMGYYADALALLKIWLKKEPASLWALDKITEYFYREKAYKEAETYAYKILGGEPGKEPVNKRAALKLANILRLQKKYKAAAALLEEVARQDPDWARPHNLLGDIAREEGQKEAAIAYYQAALERDPQSHNLAELIDYLQNNNTDLVAKYLPKDSDIEEIINKSNDLEYYPGASKAFLLDHEITIVNQDGSYKRVVTQVTRALNTEGRDAIIAENLPVGGNVKILEAYARQPDGSRQEAASIRNNVIRFRGVEVGSSTVVQYVHYAPQGAFLPQHFSTAWFFQGVENQHESSIWLLAVPKGKTLLYNKPEIVELKSREEGDYTLYEFSAAHVKPMVREASMPPIRDYLAKVVVTTVPTWDEYVAWDKSLVTAALQKDQKINELSLSLTKDIEGKLNKFWALYTYVSSEIRYQNDYENTIAGVRPHAPGLVLDRGYGDCKDKALLLIAMSEAIGLKVDYVSVLTRPYGEVQKDLPIQQFNHAITYVPKQDGVDEGFFMDPTVDALDLGNLRLDDQGALSLIMDVKSGAYRFERIPFSKVEKEKKSLAVEVDLESGDRAYALAKFILRGQLGSTVRQVLRNEEMARLFFMRLADSFFTGSKLMTVKANNAKEIDKPLELVMQLDISESLSKQGDDIRLPLPYMLPKNAEVKLESRVYPLWYLGLEGYDSELTVRLPEKAKVSFLPPDFKEEKAGTFVAERQSQSQGGEVKIKSNFERLLPQISPEDYPAYREAMIKVAKRGEDALLIKLAK